MLWNMKVGKIEIITRHVWLSAEKIVEIIETNYFTDISLETNNSIKILAIDICENYNE